MDDSFDKLPEETQYELSNGVDPNAEEIEKFREKYQQEEGE